MTAKKVKVNIDEEDIDKAEDAEDSRQEEFDELKNQLARALADYDNLKKRAEAEKKLWLKFAKEQLLVELLPAFDNVELAQKHLNDQGLGIAVSQFLDIFKANGVEEVSTDKFDEEMHEAVDVVDGGKKGKIAEVVQKGYKFTDSNDVIRPAKVKVYKGEK